MDAIEVKQSCIFLYVLYVCFNYSPMKGVTKLDLTCESSRFMSTKVLSSTLFNFLAVLKLISHFEEHFETRESM